MNVLFDNKNIKEKKDHQDRTNIKKKDLPDKIETKNKKGQMLSTLKDNKRK